MEIRKTSENSMYLVAIRARVFVTILASIFAAVEYAESTVTLAGISFEDNAFADVVVTTIGDPTFERIVGPGVYDRVATTGEDALLGHDLASMTIELQDNQGVAVAFTDNAVFNGPGDDLIIFEEYGEPEGGTIRVEVGGVQRLESAVFLGNFEVLPGVTNYINAVYVDLSDYGFVANETTQYVEAFGQASPDGSEFAVFAAYNNIPEPGTILLLGLGGLGLLRRRR